MNGYELSRKWFDWCFENPEKINPNHAALYFFIIEHCNRMGWKEKFGLPMQMAKDAIGISNYRTYSKTYKDLVEWGFLIVYQESKNQYSANIIGLAENAIACTKALDIAMQKHSQKQVHGIVGIDKHITYNLKPINKEQKVEIKISPDEDFKVEGLDELVLPEKKLPKVPQKGFSEEVHNCLVACLEFFPEELWPGKSQSNNWLETIEKLNRIDKIPFDAIIYIVKQVREDDFWSKNFLSMNKLRQKNKEGLKYIQVFYQKFKPQQKLTKNQESAKIHSESLQRKLLKLELEHQNKS